MSLELRLIVAMTRAGLMGRDGTLPWHVPEDLRHFKAATVGHAVLMGRNSFASLARPLPGRTNVVVSRSRAADAGPDGRVHDDGTRWFASLHDACAWIERARPHAEAMAWVLGGADVFRQVLAPFDDGPDGFARAGWPRPTELVVTWMPAVPLRPGDVLFPYDEAWILRHFRAASQRRGQDETLEFVTYVPRAADVPRTGHVPRDAGDAPAG